MNTRPVLLATFGDLCVRCDEPARWATSIGKACGTCAVAFHVPTAPTDPARARIEAAARIDAARYAVSA